MIHLSADIPAPIEIVWNFLTETKHLQRWWNDGVTLDAVAGGDFVEPWANSAGQRIVTSGKVLGLKEASEIRLTWRDEDWTVATEVTFTLETLGEATRLTVLHGGWQAFPESDRDGLIDAHSQGWQRHLDSLTAYATATVGEKQSA
jgi:uncharacterized protein YndB with AHSA1/START domain